MQLRTVEQLGYVCLSRVFNKAEVMGLYFLIVSSSRSTSYVKASLNRQLEVMLLRVKNLTQSEFDKMKNAVLTQYMETDKSLEAEFKWHFETQITTYKHDFDQREKDRDIIKSLTLKDIKSHFKKLFKVEISNRLDMHWNA